MNARRMLVTGAAGFVGAWIVREALKEGWTVQGLVRPGGDRRRLRELAANIDCFDADLTDGERVKSVVAAARPDVVVHAACPGGHPAVGDARDRFVREGLTMTVNLLSALETSQVSRLIYVGSATAYGPSAVAHEPADRLRPVTRRGAVKAAGSILCEQWAAERRIAYCEPRIFSAYGPWEQTNRFVPSLMLAALLGEFVPLLEQAEMRDWIYVSDAARACVTAAGASFATGVFNVCAGELRSTDELVALMEEISGRALAGPRTYKVYSGYGDSRPLARRPMLDEAAGWRPQMELRRGLMEMWAWAQTASGRRFLVGERGAQ